MLCVCVAVCTRRVGRAAAVTFAACDAPCGAKGGSGKSEIGTEMGPRGGAVPRCRVKGLLLPSLAASRVRPCKAARAGPGEGGAKGWVGVAHTAAAGVPY